MGWEGGGGAMSDGVVKKVFLSYAYVAIWIFLSFTVIVYNKYILDPKMYNWPFPISLTMVHMSFCSTLGFLLVRGLRVVDPPTSPPMTRDLYVASVVPIGALYAFSLWFANSAYIYLSVSFIQMLKALMPVAVYSIGILFKKDTFKTETLLIMLSISFGVAIAAYGEARFNAWGVMLQLAAVGFEATRLVLIQIFLISNRRLPWLLHPECPTPRHPIHRPRSRPSPCCPIRAAVTATAMATAEQTPDETPQRRMVLLLRPRCPGPPAPLRQLPPLLRRRRPWVPRLLRQPPPLGQ